MGTATSTGGGLGKDSLRKESAKCYRNIRRDESSTAWSRLQGVERGDVFKEMSRSSKLQKRKQAQTTAPGSSSLLRQDGGMCGSPQSFLKGRGGGRAAQTPTAGLRKTYSSPVPLAPRDSWLLPSLGLCGTCLPDTSRGQYPWTRLLAPDPHPSPPWSSA